MTDNENKESAIATDDISDVVTENLNDVSGGLKGEANLFRAACVCTDCGFNWSGEVCDEFNNRPTCPRCGAENWTFYRNIRYRKLSPDEEYNPTDLTRIVKTVDKKQSR